MTVSRSSGVAGVLAAEPGLSEAAERLAVELGLPCLHSGAPLPADSDTGSPRLLLVVTAERLELRSTARRGPGPVSAEFVAGARGRRLAAASARGELLARAIGLASGTRTVLDATAGLGGDAYLLAWLGATVVAVERHPVVAALLADGLRRAQASPGVSGRLGGRLQLRVADARGVLEHLQSGPADEHPDAVLIDPMFPDDGGSAASRKEMEQFRRLLGGDDDAAELLPLARAVARRRVVVKRPRHAPSLGGRPPDVMYTGRSTRFDAYLRQPANAR